MRGELAHKRQIFAREAVTSVNDEHRGKWSLSLRARDRREHGAAVHRLDLRPLHRRRFDTRGSRDVDDVHADRSRFGARALYKNDCNKKDEAAARRHVQAARSRSIAANNRFWYGERAGLPYIACAMNTTAPRRGLSIQNKVPAAPPPPNMPGGTMVPMSRAREPAPTPSLGSAAPGGCRLPVATRAVSIFITRVDPYAPSLSSICAYRRKSFDVDTRPAPPASNVGALS